MALKVPYYVMFALMVFNQPHRCSHAQRCTNTSSQVSGNSFLFPPETRGTFGKVSVWAGSKKKQQKNKEKKRAFLQEAVNKRFNILLSIRVVG